MTPKLIDLYINKYIKGSIDVHGIKLIASPSKIPGILINWEIKNPKNVSYSGYVIKNFILDSLQEFNKLSGNNSFGLLHLNDTSSFKELYISKEFYNTLKKETKKITSSKFVSKDTGELDFIFNIRNFRIEVYHEEILIRQDVIIDKIYNLSSNKIIPSDKIKSIFDYLSESDYLTDFIDNKLSPIADIIWNNPTLCDKNLNYIITNCNFLNSLGEHII